MLIPGIAFRNELEQLPQTKGDWCVVNAFKIEQNRPPLESSAAAAIDLAVPGAEPVRVTIEVVDAQNDSKGYVLRDVPVSPGQYRLYWEGIDEKQSQPANAVRAAAGRYSFRLTTSKIQVGYAGEINNSTPKYNPESYGQVSCTALALTPPGTARPPMWLGENSPPDERKIPTADSMQLLCVGYDARYGEWVGADGTMIHGKTGDARMQYGRALAVSPPDPADPADLTKQFYFASTSIGGGRAVVSCSLPVRLGKTTSKVFSSPDWNRGNDAFRPYKVQIGQVPQLLGEQHFLCFAMQTSKKESKPDWVFRSVRLYEQGSPPPEPIAFDPAKFTRRMTAGARAAAIPADAIAVADGGHTLHLAGRINFNYPADYTVTPRTVLEFDVRIIINEISHAGGIGLDPTADPKDDPQRRRCSISQPAIRAWGSSIRSSGPRLSHVFRQHALYKALLPPPSGVASRVHAWFLFQPGYYGLKISEDGKTLFACNNADNRLEVRNIGGDGGAIARFQSTTPCS